MKRSTRATFDGQPLLALGVVLAGWVAFRMVTWDTSVAMVQTGPAALPQALAQMPAARPHRSKALPAAPDRADKAGSDRLAPLEPPRPSAAPAPLPVWQGASWQGASRYAKTGVQLAGAGGVNAPADRSRPAAQAIIGHNMMLLAGLSSMQVPPALAVYLPGLRSAGQGLAGRPAAATASSGPGAVPLPYRASTPTVTARRWSADGWLLLREGGAADTLAAGQPSYGRSQAGAVVRYQLAPGSAQRPQAYVRASSALQGARESEMAVGLSARPLAGVPLRAGGEVRLRDHGSGTELRPAALAVTEFPPLRLGDHGRAEAYVQGGYVGGRFATPFVDGQARAMVDVSGAEPKATLSAGAGVWGGAQKDAARFDIGPSAALTFRLGEGRSRLALDYRVRVAGDAEPKSGPALTLSAGF